MSSKGAVGMCMCTTRPYWPGLAHQSVLQANELARVRGRQLLVHERALQVNTYPLEGATDKHMSTRGCYR